MANENKMYNKPLYKCGVCGEIYESIQERVNCETKCLKKQQEEEKKAAEAEKEAKKETRAKEVDEAIDRALELLQAYLKDYGSYKTNRKEEVSFRLADFWPKKYWDYYIN